MDLQDIEFGHLLIIVFIALLIVTTLSCISLFSPTETPPKTETSKPTQENKTITSKNITNTTAKKPVNETFVIKYFNVKRHINVTHINQINTTKEYKINISTVQRDLILNLKPNVCHTIGCSDGFDKCKRETLDILEWKKPKFREAWSTGYKTLYQDDVDNIIYYKFKIENDSFGKFYRLNNSFWTVNHPLNHTILNNLSIYNVTRNDNEDNELFNLSTVLTSLVDRETIIIRRI